MIEIDLNLEKEFENVFEHNVFEKEFEHNEVAEIWWKQDNFFSFWSSFINYCYFYDLKFLIVYF